MNPMLWAGEQWEQAALKKKAAREPWDTATQARQQPAWEGTRPHSTHAGQGRSKDGDQHQLRAH